MELLAATEEQTWNQKWDCSLIWVPIYWVITWYRTLAGGVLAASGDELLGHLGEDKAGDLLMVAVRGHESEKWALSFWEDSRRLRGRAEVAYWHQVINRDWGSC